MPKKAKATKPATKTPETKPEAPRGAKTAAIKQALKANPKKTAREIAELVKEQGFETSANYVATIKTKMKGKKKAKAAPAPTPEAAAPALPKDAISLAWLEKAKALAKQLGGVKQAKQAIDALAHIMD